MKAARIEPIDLVVVNLYPFEQTVAKPGCTLEDAIENIDIGGPDRCSLAARTTRRGRGGLAADYGRVLDELRKTVRSR